jgi:hypothetical protein
MLIIFFDIWGLFTKNSSWQFKQSAPHTTLMFYSDCVKMCEDFDPNFGDEGTGCCITTTLCLTLFHHGFFFLSKTTSYPPDAILTQLKWLRQNRRWCWTPSQNTTSKMHLKNCRSAGNSLYMRGSGLLQGWWWLVGPKLVFDQMAAPVPEIMCIPEDRNLQQIHFQQRSSIVIQHNNHGITMNSTHYDVKV